MNSRILFVFRLISYSLVIILACGCDPYTFSVPTSLNLHRTVPYLEDKHIKAGGQIGHHMNLAGDIFVKRNEINNRQAIKDDFLIKGGRDLYFLWQISRNVDVAFTFDSSQEKGEAPFSDDYTESFRFSRGYHLSSQIVVFQSSHLVCVSVIPEFAQFTTVHNLKNLTEQKINKSISEGTWVRLPLLIGMRTPDTYHIGTSLMTGPDVICTSCERDSKSSGFIRLIPVWHLIAAGRAYFFEAFFEGWVFFPENYSYKPVPGMSIGASLAF